MFNEARANPHTNQARFFHAGLGLALNRSSSGSHFNSAMRIDRDSQTGGASTAAHPAGFQIVPAQGPEYRKGYFKTFQGSVDVG
jgi:hypothetical protein